MFFYTLDKSLAAFLEIVNIYIKLHLHEVVMIVLQSPKELGGAKSATGISETDASEETDSGNNNAAIKRRNLKIKKKRLQILVLSFSSCTS